MEADAASQEFGYVNAGAWYVVLDTNAIHDDFDLTHPETTRLLNAAPGLDLRVCVPEVVIVEMTAHYLRDLDKHTRQLNDARRFLSRALGRPMPLDHTQPELDRAGRTYETRLRRRLRELGCQTLSLPRSHRAIHSLLLRARGLQKPFKDNGSGVADAILWESILELCRREPRSVALISGNRKDFGERAELHPSLWENLSAVGVKRAELHSTIRDFNASRLGASGNLSDMPQDHD